MLCFGGKTDGAAGIGDDDSLKACADGVDGRIADAVIVGEAGEEDTAEASFAKIAGEAGGGLLVVFEEGGVGVDSGTEAFAEDEFGGCDVEAGMELCAGSALNTVVGPESLRPVLHICLLERLLAGMAGGKGCVVCRMPVLGEDNVVEVWDEAVDGRHDSVSARYGETAAGAEVALDIDDEEQVVAVDANG